MVGKEAPRSCWTLWSSHWICLSALASPLAQRMNCQQIVQYSFHSTTDYWRPPTRWVSWWTLTYVTSSSFRWPSARCRDKIYNTAPFLDSGHSIAHPSCYLTSCSTSRRSSPSCLGDAAPCFPVAALIFCFPLRCLARPCYSALGSSEHLSKVPVELTFSRFFYEGNSLFSHILLWVQSLCIRIAHTRVYSSKIELTPRSPYYYYDWQHRPSCSVQPEPFTFAV